MTSQLTFGNKENPCIVHEGEEIFVSRSCGMSTVIFWEDSETNALSVAMVERGPLMPDEVGKWHFPSGYLDRDETVYEGMKREVWEETGLDIASLCETYGVGESFDQPYAIDSTPSGKQNITFHFVHHLYGSLSERPEVSFSHADDGELTGAEWFDVDAAVKMDLAWSQNEWLMMLLAHRNEKHESGHDE